MDSKSLDFTEGSISQKMLYFAWPTFVANLLQSSYQFIDSLWVGNLLGADALAAISISAPILFTILAFIIGINSATLTILSQKKGKKDEAGLKKSINAFVFILGILTLALGMIGFFASSFILRLMGTPESILPVAEIYLQVNFLGIFFLFGYNFISTVLRALGNSKAPMQFVLLAVILNAFLDPLFIYVFDLGIAGAAYATVISQGTAFLYGLWYSVNKASVPFSLPHVPEKKEITQVLKLGLPGGLQMVAISSGMIAIMTIINSFGTQVVAGFGAAQRIDSIILLPAMTIGSVVNSMSGQNIGAVKWDRVTEIAKKGLLLILILSSLISTIVFINAEFLIRLFVQEQESVHFGTTYLQIIAFFYPFVGINFILNGIARSSGAMLQVLVLNIISFWILRFPLAYLFSTWFGQNGIAWGIGASFVMSAIIAGLYYHFGKWRSIDISA